jgi:hypothetical protein
MSKRSENARREDVALRMALASEPDQAGAPIDVLDENTLRIYVLSCLICNEAGVLRQDALLRAMSKRSLRRRVDRVIRRAREDRAEVRN